MATMLMHNTMMNLDLSCYGTSTITTTSPTTTATTTTTTTTTISPDTSRDDCYNWNDLSTMMDLEMSESNNDELHGLIESMISHDEDVYHHRGRPTLERSDSVVSPFVQITDMDDDITEDAKGLRLIHLLMAAAEALTGNNKSRELARVILLRLRGLVSTNEGTNMERLAACFTEALQGLLEGIHSKLLWANGSNHKNDHHKSDVLAAFQLLQDMSPYVKFGHFTANQAILEAVENDRRIHIVDYDIMEGIQWASLMQALVSRNNGALSPHLRITAISRGNGSTARRSFGTIQETGRRLSNFAKSIGLPFSFNQCRLDCNGTFKASSLKLVRGEALVMNCMLHLPHFSYRAPDSISSFLSGAKALKARLVTLVEEEVSPMSQGGFVGKLMDSLYHYSALYDSLEAGFPMEGQARALVERMFYGPGITASVAQIYRARGGEEMSTWGEKLVAMGFCPNYISFSNNCQARLLLGVFNDGYKVEELGNNQLVLSWKSRPLISASVWTCQDY